MNNVIFNKPKTVPVKFQAGDIFKHASGVLYILAKYDTYYTLINLEHGTSYDNFDNLGSIDFSNWTYLGRNAKIIIEFDN